MIKGYLVRTGLAVFVWLLLAGTNWSSLLVGVFFIGLSVWTSVWLNAHTVSDAQAFHMRFASLPGFLWFFIYQSVLGGLDTAKRAFASTVTTTPDFTHYRIQWLPITGVPYTVFTTMVSLMPGSISVLRESGGVLIHTLAVQDSTHADIQACEAQVAKLFGIDITAGQDSLSTKRRASNV